MIQATEATATFRNDSHCPREWNKSSVRPVRNAASNTNHKSMHHIIYHDRN